MCMQSKSNLCGNSYFPAAGQAGRAAGRTAGRTARKAAWRAARKAARKAVRKADVAVTGSCQQLSNKISSWNANIVADGYLFGLFFFFSFSVVFVCLVLRIRLETERLGKEFSCKRANQGPWNSGQLCESVLGSGKCTQLSSFSFFFFFSFGSVCGVQNLQNLKKRGWRMGPAGDLKVQLAGDAVNKLYYIHITQCTFCWIYAASSQKAHSTGYKTEHK